MILNKISPFFILSIPPKNNSFLFFSFFSFSQDLIFHINFFLLSLPVCLCSVKGSLLKIKTGSKRVLFETNFDGMKFSSDEAYRIFFFNFFFFAFLRSSMMRMFLPKAFTLSRTKFSHVVIP